MTTTAAHFVDDPVCSVSGRFALARPTPHASSPDTPSPVGVRPWGLRRMEAVSSGEPLAGWRYDHDRQLLVDDRRREVVRGDGWAADGQDHQQQRREDPPSSEDWPNDFTPDQPYEP